MQNGQRQRRPAHCQHWRRQKDSVRAQALLNQSAGDQMAAHGMRCKNMRTGCCGLPLLPERGEIIDPDCEVFNMASERIAA